jgi:NAD(P)-dependent dehydrogenase (short-subunit alcohol dehydrogenase family)
VAGATGDIGRAVAMGLAAEGVRVVLAGRDAARLRAVASELGDAAAGTVVMDFASEGSIKSGIDEAWRLAGALDIMVCTVVSNTFGTVWELDRKDWEDLFRIKYMGTVDLSRGVARRMVARGSGVIINFIGIATDVLYPTNPAGGDANLAAARFTRFLAAKVATAGVRVLGVSPGFVEGRRLSAFRDAEKANLAATVPLGRIGTPREMADLAVFLASPRAGYMTGNIVALDGGVSLHTPPGKPATPDLPSD